MTLPVRDLQARCAALGFWPGPIDGVMGKRTQQAYDDARRVQEKRKLPFIHASGLHRIHLHWTAGHHEPTKDDQKHYHALFTGAGRMIEANPVTTRLAHTLNANSGAIGLAVCGMALAQERPFSPGDQPITMDSIKAMCAHAGRLSRLYDIPVSRWSILTHAEVQLNLGIKQRQKWDINWLPGDHLPSDPVAHGDRLRSLITATR